MRTRPNQTRPNPTRPDQTPPDQTKPDQTKPHQTRPNPTRSDQTRPDQTRPDQTKPHQTRPNQTRPDQNHTRNCRLFIDPVSPIAFHNGFFKTGIPFGLVSQNHLCAPVKLPVWCLKNGLSSTKRPIEFKRPPLKI
jgi:hypothetical protein